MCRQFISNLFFAQQQNCKSSNLCNVPISRPLFYKVHDFLCILWENHENIETSNHVIKKAFKEAFLWHEWKSHFTLARFTEHSERFVRFRSPNRLITNYCGA